MQETSALHKELLSLVDSGEAWMETRLSIGTAGSLITKFGEKITFGGISILVDTGGADGGYGEEMLSTMGTDLQLFSEDVPAVGCCVAGEISVKMRKPTGTIPRQARLVPYVRLTDGIRHSEWIQKGVFWIDTRSEDDSGENVKWLNLTGYDSMLKAEMDYPLEAAGRSDVDIDVVRYIASLLGTTVDRRTIYRPEYMKASGELIHLKDAENRPLKAMTIYGQSTQDGTPSPDNPVEIVSKGDSEELTVTAAGKNLLPYPYAHTTKTVNGLTFTDNGDGSITVNGTATANTNFICGAKLALIKGVYTFSDKFGESNYLYVDAFLDGVWVKACRTTFESDGRYTYNLFVHILEGEVCDNLTIAPMLELGSTPTAYEPYRATTATLTNASHPDTPIFPLCGIPVDSGGNVTIDGQQYIADTLTKFADGTGEVVKYTAIIDSYDGETIDTAYMSTTGELSTGATVLYALETPITIPLTAEEVAALEALQTYKPVSNVYNDAGAYMDVEYHKNHGVEPVMNKGYRFPYQSGYSCREYLGYIAGAYGGCFVMTDIGELRLIQLNGIPEETRYLITSGTDAGPITFGGVRILV